MKTRILATLLMAFAFVACDDGDQGNDGGGHEHSYTTRTVAATCSWPVKLPLMTR